MPSEATLRGVDAKHARAVHLLDGFEAEVRPFLQTYSDSIREEVVADGARHKYWLSGAPQVPSHWSAVVGDILHNLRSALDHLAWQLVLVSGGEPTRDTHFPILHKPPEDGPPDIRPGVTDEARRLLHEVQPYARAVPSLLLLRYFNNIDKHREVLPTVAYLRHAGWGTPEGVSVTAETRSGAREGDDLALILHCSPAHPEPLRPTLEFGLGVHPDALASLARLDPPTDPDDFNRGDLLGWALGMTTNFVGRTIERFRRFFE